MDILSDIENMDVMLGKGDNNPIERDLDDAIEQSSMQGDIESSEQLGNQYKNFTYENSLPRQSDVRQSFEMFSNEFNLRLSQEMDSMMSMMHSQINRAISNAISKRVIPEIQNIVSSMSSSGTLRLVYLQIVTKTGNIHPGLNRNLQKVTQGLRVI